MVVQAKADGNVPHIGPRARYNIVGHSARWIFHIMENAIAPAGEAPATVAVGDPADLDPVVSPGRADYGFPTDKLVEGGLFTHLGKVGHAVILESAILPGNPKVETVDASGTPLRVLAVLSSPLTGFPIRLGAGEYVKISGGTTGGDFGLFARLDGVKLL